MITKIPIWVWLFTWVLALVAGMVNVIGYLSFEHQAVTHLTGTTSLLGSALANKDINETFHLTTILLAFVLGASLSGILIKDEALKLGRSYGLVLAIETFLLLWSVPLLNANSPVGIYFAGGACGLQNAMASTYSGALIRTSHVTGMFTDLGIYLGHFLRGTKIDLKRLKLCLIVISGFLCGGTVGSILFTHLHYETLYVAATIIGLVALSYSALQIYNKKFAREKRQIES